MTGRTVARFILGSPRRRWWLYLMDPAWHKAVVQTRVLMREYQVGHTRATWADRRLLLEQLRAVRL